MTKIILVRPRATVEGIFARNGLRGRADLEVDPRRAAGRRRRRRAASIRVGSPAAVYASPLNRLSDDRGGARKAVWPDTDRGPGV